MAEFDRLNDGIAWIDLSFCGAGSKAAMVD
jgi:hypothetical protein